MRDIIDKAVSTVPIDQAETKPATTWKIMRSADFARGVAEVREGLPPNFDANDSWNYERGRQFGLIVPRNLPLYQGRLINPVALRLCERAFERNWICP